MASVSEPDTSTVTIVPMARKLAYRNLFHDRLSLFVLWSASSSPWS